MVTSDWLLPPQSATIRTFKLPGYSCAVISATSYLVTFGARLLRLRLIHISFNVLPHTHYLCVISLLCCSIIVFCSAAVTLTSHYDGSLGRRALSKAEPFHRVEMSVMDEIGVAVTWKAVHSQVCYEWMKLTFSISNGEMQRLGINSRKCEARMYHKKQTLLLNAI